MSSSNRERILRGLGGDLFALMSSFPPARAELLDFHFQTNYDEYVETLQQLPGRKLLVSVDQHADAGPFIRRLALYADTVILSSADATARSGLGFFPIGDQMRSPVLGLVPAMDEHGKWRPAPPALIAQVVVSLAEQAVRQQTSANILGRSWTPGVPGWEPTIFTRTSEPYKNTRGEACHIAAGIIHGGEPPLYDWLETEANPLIIGGHLVFAPFVVAPANGSGVAEGALKASMFESTFTLTHGTLTTDSGSVHPLTQLQVPYLENVPLPMLAKIIKDERESLRAFRREVDRAVEDIAQLSDPAEAAHRMVALRRDLLEDELDRVRQTCERVSRMNALTRIGAYVGTAALSIAGILGLAPPSVLCGAAGVATATVAELYRNFEERRSIRTSPMHFVWQLQKAPQTK